jgi:hypothetical protein
MWRYGFTALVALGLVGVGVAAFNRGQTVIGIALVAMAVLRVGSVLVPSRPRKPQPSIRLNLDDDANSSDEPGEHRGSLGS